MPAVAAVGGVTSCQQLRRTSPSDRLEACYRASVPMMGLAEIVFHDRPANVPPHEVPALLIEPPVDSPVHARVVHVVNDVAETRVEHCHPQRGVRDRQGMTMVA